jgi:hypothetical protein
MFFSHALAKRLPSQGFTEAFVRLIEGDGTPPQYDLENFRQKVPTNINALTLGAEEILKPQEAVAPPFFQNRAWLWAAMLLIISILLWGTFKMLRENKPPFS